MTYKPRLTPIVILIAFASLLLAPLEKFADDPGVGWHLVTGEKIVESGGIPYFDPHLFAREPRSWVSDQWLSDLLMALVYRWGGFPLLYALGTVLFVSTFFALLNPTLKRLGNTAVPALIATFFAFKIAQIHFILRPVLIAFFFFAALFGLIVPIYQNGDRLLPSSDILARLKRCYVVIPLGFVFWANLHPSFSLGLTFLLLVTVGFFLDQFFFPESWPNNSLVIRKRGLAILFLLSFTATFINPYGWHLHQSILDLSSSSFFMNYHQEWLTPDFSKPEGQFFEWFIFAAILALFLPTRSRCVSLVDFVLIAAFVHLGFDAVRFLPFLGIVMAPYLTRSFEIFGKLKGYPGMVQARVAFLAIEKRELLSTGFSTLVVLSFVLIGSVLIERRLPLYQGSYGPSPKNFPYQEIAQLKSHLPNGERVIIAADPYFGGFITWQGADQIQAVIDDRNTLLGEKIYQESERYLTGQEGWRDYFRSLGATHLMLRKNEAFARKLRDESVLKTLAEGEVVTIFSLN